MAEEMTPETHPTRIPGVPSAMPTHIAGAACHARTAGKATVPLSGRHPDRLVEPSSDTTPLGPVRTLKAAHGDLIIQACRSPRSCSMVEEDQPMKLEWDFTAESYLDQLPPEERSKVLHAVERLPAVWDDNSPGHNRLHRLRGGQDNLYSLRVGNDLRVLVSRRDDVINVVDVVRRSQIDGLRRISSMR